MFWTRRVVCSVSTSYFVMSPRNYNVGDESSLVFISLRKSNHLLKFDNVVLLNSYSIDL